jgi:hypothetical protein
MISTKDNRGSQADDAGRDPGGGERAASDAGGASIEKVRDILFGQHVREFERRFTRLEDRILKETGDLKEQLIARIATLEAFTKRETESLAEQIKVEHDHRVESHSSVSRELKDAASALERRTSALDDQLSKSQREIRQQILDQHQHLSDDIRRKMDEVLATLAREAQELRSDKADRATIAALLTEMAVRLTDDFPISREDARDG